MSLTCRYRPAMRMLSTSARLFKQNSKDRLNLPPSFKSSKPLPQNTLTDADKERIQNASSTHIEPTPITYKRPWWIPLLKFGVVFVPFFICGAGYIIYETVNGRPVFLPLWVNSSVPLEKAIGFENIDVEALKAVCEETLVKRLNMNHLIKEYFGLPVELGEYESFDVRIQYNRLAIEGIELDFRRSWFKPIFKWREIDTPALPPNINKYIQPLKARVGDGGVDEDPDQEVMYIKEINYKIMIRATIKVVNEKIHRIEPGTGRITFDAEIDLDHTKYVKIVGALMHFKNINNTGSGGTLERLW
ncbi:hypothetical protein CANINC_000698 [Pichia inconspicua]|uniref:Uncharacterized protein n=1 Tax=Pichia inconspicua TaxID=52247 RepID=A0A4T0X6Y4_9ASCO|nr:hypothetical protein CANINC_000698 [[Candida] inconspicua]